MQIPIPKLKQIISKKPGFFVWKIENFYELQLPYTAWNIPKYGEYYFSILIKNTDEYIISSEYGVITEIQIYYKNTEEI